MTPEALPEGTDVRRVVTTAPPIEKNPKHQLGCRKFIIDAAE